MHCSMLKSISDLHQLDASSSPVLTCDSQKCFYIWPNVPGVGKRTNCPLLRIAGLKNGVQMAWFVALRKRLADTLTFP